MLKNVLIIVVAFMFVLTSQISFSQTKAKIDKANAKGNTVFLVVVNGKIKLAETNLIAVNAQKKAKKSEVVTLDVSDKSNQELITKYQLSGVEPPLILVISTKGVVAGGYLLADATPEKLVEIIPTKKQEETLLAFTQGKAVFIVLSKKSMTDKAKAVEECKTSCFALKSNAVIIEIDLDDKSEATFLKLLAADMTSTKTNVLVFNSKGQFTSKFEAPVKSISLTASANKVAGGCNPGSCNPKNCKK